MTTPHSCPQCGARLTADQTCETHFHQMLFWENDVPARGVVHHLMVVSYNLQHPAILSPEGLQYSIGLLNEFLTGTLTLAALRASVRAETASDRRHWPITARPGAQAAYNPSIAWALRTTDVIAAGADAYVERVRAWAASIRQSLRTAGYLKDD
jgi:hypothetical protein